MRAQRVFPDAMAALIAERTIAFTAEMHPRSTFETWAIGELAAATVQVEVGSKRLLEDEVRIINRVSGPGWEADASAAADRLANRLGRHPYRTARELERTKQGTNILVYHLNGLADAARTKNALDDTQRGLLFDVLGVPLPLRDGNRRVPAAGDGPALVALIEQEIARHEANLLSTLNQRDRDDQLQAMKCPNTYLDKMRRQLRSDEARAVKRLVWVTDVLDQLRRGVAASSRTTHGRATINPKARPLRLGNLLSLRRHPHLRLRLHHPLRKRRRKRLRLRI